MAKTVEIDLHKVIILKPDETFEEDGKPVWRVYVTETGNLKDVTEGVSIRAGYSCSTLQVVVIYILESRISPRRKLNEKLQEIRETVARLYEEAKLTQCV